MAARRLRIMVSSTVYGMESLLEQIHGILVGYGYEVWMSHKGTIPTDPRKSAFENCLDAVDACDLFLGLVTGKYGSGKQSGEISITHQEVLRAVELNKLRWFLVHRDVIIARQVLKQFRFDREGNPLPLDYKPNAILSDIRVLEMYEGVIQNSLPLSERRGNWVQEYSQDQDIQLYLKTQFEKPARIRRMLQEIKTEQST